MLRLLHTADWHLGRRFPSFPQDVQKKLSRARLDVIGNILDVARRNSVNALLCAGDLFDDPEPEPDFWEGLARILQQHAAPHPPIFLVPGNHDPLIPESVWAPNHPFRARLPKWVHVVDRDDFTYELSPEVVLYARPCRSKAGENDLAMALPARESGDERIRIGCVHGSTFDMEGYQTNFPICRDAGVQRGLDYLAIGDTHSFRDVTPSLPVPTVYPGAPEPTTFGEPGAGSVALVALFRHGRRPRVEAEPVAYWRDRADPSRSSRTFLRQGRRHIQVQADNMSIQIRDGQHSPEFVHVAALNVDPAPDDLPPVLQDTVDRLEQLVATATEESEKSKATRALAHLYKLLQNHAASVGRVL